jgi:tetratricopeptide (TPR) repeat protein
MYFASAQCMESRSPVAAKPYLVLALVAVTAACAPQTTTPPPSQADSPPTETGTLVPDPNEPPEVVAQYQEARRLIAQGQHNEARALLDRAVEQFPESRHLHQAYADLLWYESKGSDPALLRQSAEQAVRATELGLRSGTVDYALTARLAATLGRTGDKDRLDHIFKQLLAKDPSSTMYLDYAAGLALVGNDVRAEDAFRQALRSDPNGDAAAQYAEWLLDRRREREALEVLPKETPVYYIHFLRGVALERLGHREDARAAYDRYREYNKTFPAPTRFRIAGSPAQSGIRFEDKDNS